VNGKAVNLLDQIGLVQRAFTSGEDEIANARRIVQAAN
jgi:citrate lyase beta subunit